MVQCFHSPDDFGHLVDGVFAFLRRGAVGGHPVSCYPDLGLALVAQGDDVVAGLTDDAAVRMEAPFPVEMLQVLPVAVFLTDGPRDVYGLPLQPALVPRQRCAINGRAERRLHVHAPAAPEPAVHDTPLKGRIRPLLRVIGPHGVHVGVKLEHCFPTAHPADNVTGLIDDHLVVPQLFHLRLDKTGHVSLLVGETSCLHGSLCKTNQLFVHRVLPRKIDNIQL